MQKPRRIDQRFANWGHPVTEDLVERRTVACAQALQEPPVKFSNETIRLLRNIGILRVLDSHWPAIWLCPFNEATTLPIPRG